MTETKRTLFREKRFLRGGTFAAVETTARGVGTMAVIVAYEASRAGVRWGVPGSERFGNKLEHVLYTEELIKKRREKRNNSSES